MGGGPSHMDTWDLKPDSEKNGGPFKPIETSAPGVQISEHLPNVAKQMKHLNIIRSLNSKEGNHDRGTYMMHTGYAPNPTVVHPGFGSYCSVRAGREAAELRPAALHRDQLAERGAGFLGMSHSPFVVQNPNAPIANLKAAQRVMRCGWSGGCRCSSQVEKQLPRAERGQAGRRSQGGLREDGPDDEFPVHQDASISTTSRPRFATLTAVARSDRAA